MLGECQTWDEVWHGGNTEAEEHAKALAIIQEALQLDPQPLSLITGPEVGEAARHFKQKTATPDGWHPKTFGLVSSEGQDCLARILNTCECIGSWPEQQSSIHMSIQRKPAGGKRLIGWYRALFRLWCMLRADLWREWENKHGSASFFSNAKGNSVIDVGWRQAVRAEVARLDGKHVVIVAQDLKKCYEYIRYHILAAKAAARKFPLRLVRVTVLSYGWHRHLVHGSIIADGITAWRGVVAGCVAATRELKLCVRGALSNTPSATRAQTSILGRTT